MKEHKNRLTSEAIDRQTERRSGELSQEEQLLVQDIYSLSQAYARENERSLERIWSRFVQRQEQPNFLQERQPKEPGGKQFAMEGKGMQEKDIFQETGFLTLPSQPVKGPGRSAWRTLSIIGAVAVVLITILSWALLSYGLRHGSQNPTTNSRQTTQTGAAQKGIHSGSLLCSFSDDNSALHIVQQPTLDWSSQGQIAATYANLKTFSAQNCAPASSDLLPQAQQANWSPDGKRLLVLDGTSKAEVLDASTGRVIVSFTGKDPGDFVSQSVWSSNGTQVLSEVIQFPTKTSSIVSVQIWNAATGAFIRTALTFNTDIQLQGVSEYAYTSPISSNGKYNAIQKSNNAIEIWNIETGKMVSSIPFNQSGVSAMAWSPGGASLALGLPNASVVQIWSTATGQLSSTFKDSDTWAKVIGALAWSPNGKYLAESISDIHIWDVKGQKLVATFGRVNKVHCIPALAWSPESSMLTSSTVHIAGPGDQTHNTVNVWKLS